MNLKGSTSGLAAFITIVLALLKSRGTIDISWAWVLAPIAVYFMGATISFIRLFIRELNNTNVSRTGKKK